MQVSMAFMISYLLHFLPNFFVTVCGLDGNIYDQFSFDWAILGKIKIQAVLLKIAQPRRAELLKIARSPRPELLKIM